MIQRLSGTRAAMVFALAFTLFISGACPGRAEGQDGPPGPPPALVVTATATSGVIAPEAEFSGTVYYREVSEVAAEVRGLVEKAPFEEGDRIRAGDTLARLRSDLMEKSIEGTSAKYVQASADLERAEIDLARTRGLFDKGLASRKAYDDARLLEKSLTGSAASLKADLERLEAELGKKTIPAPFTGVALARHVERGEWVEPGATIATLAGVDVVDVVVDVPQEVASGVKEGAPVPVRSLGRTYAGRVVAVVPRGDVRTRTFPVKIRLTNDGTLMEGMEAVATLPRGTRVEAVIVPRDAVIEKFGRTVVFTVLEGKAKMTPVKVLGWSGGEAGVAGISEGTAVVVKGNERLRDDQPVVVKGAGGRGAAGEK
ncbi:MAG: efflux RND transporter periplasmic adaptor subunit [Thermodesulfobacteriota bacterium]